MGFFPIMLRPEAPRNTPILDRYKNRELLYDVLYCVAVGGLSIRADIARALRMDLTNEKAKTASLRKVSRACKTLAYENLITQDFGKVWWMTIYMIRLTPFGRKYGLETYGWEVEESDWDKLIHRHNGKKYLEHSAAVLLFAYHARLRGWNVKIMPEDPEFGTQPDVSIENMDWELYVEVERKASRAWTKRKRWEKQYKIQEAVTICMVSEDGARNIAQKIREMEKYEYYCIASLEHLAETAYQPNRGGSMWLYQRGFDVLT